MKLHRLPPSIPSINDCCCQCNQGSRDQNKYCAYLHEEMVSGLQGLDERHCFIKVFEDFVKNLCCNPTTFGTKGETVYCFIVENALWTARIVFSWSTTCNDIDFSIRLSRQIYFNINSFSPLHFGSGKLAWKFTTQQTAVHWQNWKEGCPYSLMPFVVLGYLVQWYIWFQQCGHLFSSKCCIWSY